MANYSDIRYVNTGTTEYATADNLPASNNSVGDQAFVTASNRLYLWTGTGWYNIALINTAPSISGVNSSYDLAIDGTATVITLTSTDPEGLPITYSIASDTSGSIATVTQGTGASSNVFTITPSTDVANVGTFSLTFRASDGVNIASSVASFTLFFDLTIENSNYTTALITSVGSNNADNNDFVDSSTNSYTITAAGNVTQTTFSPYRHGGYSTYFDGSGDYLRADTALDGLTSGSSSWTIDFWIWSWTSLAGGSRYPLSFNRASDGINIFLWGGEDVIYNGGNSTSLGVSFPTKTWVYVQLIYDGSSLKIYHDGSLTSTTSTGALSTAPSSCTLGIGAEFDAANGGTPGNYLQGYIRDFRVTEGALTASTSAPTEPVGLETNTTLLTCHLPYIADGSTNQTSVSSYGNIEPEPFAPYDYETYSASNDGGSIYFDGSGDYLQAPAASVARGTGNWTIEFWAYFHSLATTNMLWDARTGASPTDDFLSVQSDGSFRYRSNGITVSSAGDVTLRVWHHIAQVLNNGTLKTYVDGTEVASSSQTSNLSHGAALTIGGSALDNANWCNANFADFRVVLGTAVYTSAFTPPTAPLTAISGTSLLLKGTNAGIIDKSQSVQTLTLNGNVSSSTTQSKYLTSSMYFNGTSDYITVSKSDLIFNWSNEDFTIEAWVYPTASSGYNVLFGDWGPTPRAFATGILNGNWYFTWTPNGGSTSTLTGSAVTLNQWYHFAVTKSGTTVKIYIDGTLDATQTGVSLDNSSTNGTVIGSKGNLGDYFDGYVSDFRFSRGLVRYTSNFTPPTEALGG